LIAHACGLPIRNVRIDVTTKSGTDVDRGYDPASADGELRNNATEHRIEELLPPMQRDLAVALGGISAEQLHGVYSPGDPENRDDETRAERLASNVTLGRWKISKPRPAWADREQAPAYTQRVKSFVDALVKRHARGLDALAERLETAVSISGEEAHRILEERGVSRGSAGDPP